MRAGQDQYYQTRLLMGMSEEQFAYPLNPGEQFQSPEVILSYSSEGLSKLSQNMHRCIRSHLCRGKYKETVRPILLNSWEASYFDFTGDSLLALAQQAADLGIEMFVLDDGWFGNRCDDSRALGDWWVNEDKLKGGLSHLIQRVNDLGVQFGIWYEPEMISPDSDLYRSHPDWAVCASGREKSLARNQCVLDMTRQDVRDSIFQQMYDVLSQNNIAYIKWDCNRRISEPGSEGLPPERQDELLHRYVLGLYHVMDVLTKRFPDVLFENCASGGARMDAGMMYYFPQTWASDNSDAVCRLKIQYGTSFAYPMSSVSAHVSVCPNHQNSRVTPFKTRGICAMQGAFGYELDLSRLNVEDKEEIRKQVKIYKENFQVIQTGDYYRLTSPWENRDVTVWSYVAEDRSRAILSAVYTDLHANPAPVRVHWKGLEADAVYEVEGREYTGAALMYGGYLLPVPGCNYDSCMLVAVKKN